MPTLVHDLPGGAPRMSQRSVGFLATLVGGEVLIDRGEPTAARPGRLVHRPTRTRALGHRSSSPRLCELFGENGVVVKRQDVGMTKRARYSEYKDRYTNVTFELSDEGILFMQCHTNGDSLVWSWEAHDGMSDAFADIAGDREIKVLIHTGTGRELQRQLGSGAGGSTTKPIYLAMDGQEGLMQLDEKAWYGRMLVEHPRGRGAGHQRGERSVQHPCRGSAAERHRAGVGQRVLPGPGALPVRSGARGRITRALADARRSEPRPIDAPHGEAGPQEALDWGVVAEVLPQDQLVDRAWEIARDLALRPPLVLRYTRQLFMQSFKRAFLDELDHGLARETYAQRQFFPQGGGMRGLDRAWDQEPGPTDDAPELHLAASGRAHVVT